MSSEAASRSAVEDIARTSYGRIVAYLASITGDIASAEDAVGDALLAALSSWPARGVPDRPDSWLLTAARRNIIDAARRREVARKALPAVAQVLAEQAELGPASALPDVRLGLMFECAHPAIDAGMRSPLILQTVLGLDAARISAAFVVAPATMGQRLVRAKAKIKAAGVPFRVPEVVELPDRLDAVLDAVYAAYGTAWDDPDAVDPARAHLTDEAIRLARLLTELLPAEPEAHGLLALLLHSHARRGARRGAEGEYIPLAEQDVSLWSRDLVEDAERHLAAALALRRPGPYQLQAAIQSVHNLRAATGRTDWAAIAALYDGLVRIAPTLGAAVARAAAYRRAAGPAAALSVLQELTPERVRSYQPYWVVLALCEADLHRPGAGATAQRALELTDSPAVRAHLHATLLGRA